MQEFLELGYYRKFRGKYSNLTGKLSSIIRSKKIWKWVSTENETFKEIKQSFCKSIALGHSNFNTIFYINTDATDVALRAELYQTEQRSTTCVCKSNDMMAEHNYSGTEAQYYFHMTKV